MEDVQLGLLCEFKFLWSPDCALQDSTVTVLCGKNPRDILRVVGMYVTSSTGSWSCFMAFSCSARSSRQEFLTPLLWLLRTAALLCYVWASLFSKQGFSWLCRGAWFPFFTLMTSVQQRLLWPLVQRSKMVCSINLTGYGLRGTFQGLLIDHITSKLLRFCSVPSTKHVLSCLHVEILLSHMPFKTVLSETPFLTGSFTTWNKVYPLLIPLLPLLPVLRIIDHKYATLKPLPAPNDDACAIKF